jgi:hypothetical protein
VIWPCLIPLARALTGRRNFRTPSDPRKVNDMIELAGTKMR